MQKTIARTNVTIDDRCAVIVLGRPRKPQDVVKAPKGRAKVEVGTEQTA